MWSARVREGKKRDLGETVLASISAVKPIMPGQRCVHAALLYRCRPDIFAPGAAGKAFPAKWTSGSPQKTRERSVLA
jgi:hypothetical protein